MNFTIWIFLSACQAKNALDRKKPNIILLVTDDQDILMKSEDVMEKTRRLIVEGGIKFKNAFTTTPTCCPSRSSFLTGLYAHNHGIMTNNGNCTGEEWKEKFENRTYGVKLQEQGYTTAFFGKYLNEYTGDYKPPGWDKWFGLIKNSRYYNYTIAKWEKGRKSRCENDRNSCEYVPKRVEKPTYGNDDAPKKCKYGFQKCDYLTNVITRNAVKYFKRVKSNDPDEPVLMVLNYPAPHGPEDASPKYENSLLPGGTKYEEYKHLLTAHRDSNTYDYVDKSTFSKHWFLRSLEHMDEKAKNFTDFLQLKRLQTLFSVDDSVEKVYRAVEETGQLDNTYFIYTSDHGYHLGHFGVVKGKALPYDFDTRIPYYIKGPGIPKNETRDQIVLNIDLMPTLLEIGGPHKWALEEERKLDGVSFLDIAKNKNSTKPWRNYFLIERGKFPMNLLNPRPDRNRVFQEYLSQLCPTEKYAYPDSGTCREGQRHYCTYTDAQGYKLEKCEISREGFAFKNGECCCHGCLRKNQRRNNWCPKTRTTRAANHPRYQPLDEQCLVEERNCTCTNENKSKQLKLKDTKPKPLNEIREKMKQEKEAYEKNKAFHQRIRSQHNKSVRKEKQCGGRGLACYTVDNESFQTEPRWTNGDACYCSNASNGTFFCIRGLNETDNYLYCEFMTNHTEYYNLTIEPDFIMNQWNAGPIGDGRSMDVGALKRLKDQLFRCKGEECKPEIVYPRERPNSYYGRSRLEEGRRDGRRNSRRNQGKDRSGRRSDFRGRRGERAVNRHQRRHHQPRSDRPKSDRYRQFKTQYSNPLVHFVNAKSTTWSKLPSEVQIIEIDARPF